MHVKPNISFILFAVAGLMQVIMPLSLTLPSGAQQSSETAKEQEKIEQQLQKVESAAEKAKIKEEEAAERAKIKEEEAAERAKIKEEEAAAAWRKHHPTPPSPAPKAPSPTPPSPTPPAPAPTPPAPTPPAPTPPAPTPPAPTPPSPAPTSGNNPLANWVATNSIFNTDISTMPVNKHSATWINTYGSASIHPDFGTMYNYGNGNDIWGYALNTVPDSTPLTDLSKLFAYGDQSDVGPPSPPYPTAGAVGYPLTSNMIVEGSKFPGGLLPDSSSGSDCHIFLFQPDYKLLYEIYAVSNGPGVAPSYASGAIWNLASNQMRPAGWTSSDASGCAVSPILIKYEEATSAAGIKHALRFTTNWTNDASPSPDWPASHVAGVDNSIVPDMGACWRLKASYDISGFSPTNQAILQAMKTYGMYDDDNGGSGYIQGLTNPNWDDADINNLKNVHLSDGDFVDISSLQVSPTSYQAIQPSGTNSVTSSGSSNTSSGGSSSALSVNESHHTMAKARSIKK